MSCNYFDCFTCPYSDCIATDNEALERDKAEGWHDSGVIGSYEENYQKWLIHLEKEREKSRIKWARKHPKIKKERKDEKAYFAEYRASHREEYRAYQKNYRKRKALEVTG